MTDSERLARLETLVTEIHHRLLGNGQPGEISLLHDRINSHGSRIAKLENWRWWVVGIAIGLGMASGAGLTHFLEAAIK